MSVRVSFADLLKKGAEKEQQRIDTKPALSVVETESQLTPPTQATPPTPPTSKTKLPVSPERDFAKVANSIVRDAISQGLFIGKSKQIYDFLYLQTRGAIQPTRNVRMTKSNLMRGSDIGSERTLLKNLTHLKSIGLIKIREFEGQHKGNEYEVFLPEECPAFPPHPPHPPHPRDPLQKVGTLPPLESGVGGVGQMQENKDSYSVAKTSFKDSITNDDEAFADFRAKMSEAVTEITGKKLSKRDRENLSKLADLLILELKVAARRTDSISSASAFLTEIVRRKLRNGGTPAAASKMKIDTVGKPEPETYEIKALDAKGREAALNELREFASDPMLEDFKKWYTPEDWFWLLTELGKKSKEK